MHDAGTETLPIQALLRELGQRLERYRLSRNLRQEDVAAAAGLSRMTVGKLERGGGTLDTLARVLRALDLDGRILDVVPDARVSPMDPRSVGGEGRQRARPSNREPDAEPWSWGDE
ncbi:MAG: helix-turn-helix transcriptional regulator [Pigmentiphaga sp.]|nr:helix-turn-helix transcriptional regulator [Pigmentiphaga sp.]